MDFFRRISAARKKNKRPRRSPRFSRWNENGGLLYEALESRHLLTIALTPIVGPDSGSAFDVPSGKDLYVPLTATDPGQTITYSVTSSNPSVTASVLTGNPTLRLSVTGVGSDGQSFSGTMTVQLFEDLAPDTVHVIEQLVESGFYDNLSFYRIVPTFVIQGGANNTKTADTFADEFNVALSFNSPGLLAMANPGTPNSNTSEIFITDINSPLANLPQYLNFRHSIFGQLTSGFDVYNEIMNAQGITSTNSSPTTPVTITSATIITDTQNGVVQISENAGFTGTTTITVTATSTDGSSAQTSFTANVVTATATSNSQPLVLNPVNDLVTNLNTPVTFQLTASQYNNGNLTFSVTGDSTFQATPSNVSVVVTPGDAGTATVTLTPLAGFSGTIGLLAHVDDTSSAFHNAQAFSLTVVAPVEILSVTDPINSSDAANVTASGRGQVGAGISLVAGDGTNNTAPYTTTVASDGTWSISGIDATQLADGVITFTVSSTDSDGQPVETTSTATKDTVAPAVNVVSVTNPINGANANSVAISGDGEVGATISVVAATLSTSSTTYTTTVDGSGHWSISGIATSTLSEGTITFLVTAADSAGNTTKSSTTSFKDTLAPQVALDTATNPISIANSSLVSASGTAEAGAIISVVVSDGVASTVAATTTAGSDGAWSVSGIDVSGLADGDVTYTATASDAAGNTSQSSLTAVKETVTITLITNPINAANAGSTSVSGTGQAGATISLVVTDGAVTTSAYTTTVGEGDTWSIAGIDVTHWPTATLSTPPRPASPTILAIRPTAARLSAKTRHRRLSAI